jgi:tetratricopeptide (TPR) repeat protein
MADSPSELNAEIEKLELKHAEHPEGRFFVPLANAYRKAGEVEHAESLLREGLRRHPDYLSAHIVLGRCLADRGAMAEASEEFRYVLSIDPQNLIALRTLGELAVAGSRRDEAVRWYEELLGVDPMNEDARRALESLRQSGGEVGEEFRAGAAWWDGEGEAAAPADAVPASMEDDALPLAEEARGGGYDPFSTGSVSGLEGGEPALQDPPVAGEVVTETIAELYARQGLVERAAEVYRELIRRRGEVPALQRRLAELEHQLGSATAPPPLPEPPAPPAPEPVADTLPELVLEREPEPLAPETAAPAADPFATSFEHGFQLQDGAEPAPLEPEATPRADAEPQHTGPGIAEFLRSLVAWRVGSEPRPAAEPAPDQPSPPEPSLPATSFAEPAPHPEPAAEADSFPWETSAPAAPAAREEEPDEELFSFDSFFNEDAASPEPPASAPAEPAAAAEEEDDDLESFQAWLRSLKR